MGLRGNDAPIRRERAPLARLPCPPHRRIEDIQARLHGLNNRPIHQRRSARAAHWQRDRRGMPRHVRICSRHLVPPLCIALCIARPLSPGSRARPNKKAPVPQRDESQLPWYHPDGPLLRLAVHKRLDGNNSISRSVRARVNALPPGNGRVPAISPARRLNSEPHVSGWVAARERSSTHARHPVAPTPDSLGRGREPTGSVGAR